MKKKISISLAVAVTLLAMTVTFSLTMIIAMKIFDGTVSSVKQKELMYNKIAEIDQVVRSNFYGDINNDTLYDMIGTGYIAGLGDRGSNYYTAKQLADISNKYAGNNVGVGVDVVKDVTGYAKIIKVYNGSPAEESEITKGSYITKVDGVDLKTTTQENIRTLLQGETGTVVKLTVVIGTKEEEISITRKLYDAPTVEASLQGDVGYIKISVFNNKTPAEFDAAVRSMENMGAESLVFDVRNNSGGMLESAARMLDVLCPTGALISAQYKSGEAKVLYTSDASQIDLPMVVLTNKNTASAAEIFAIVLRDYGKASIVGEKTYGKGTIQNLYRLSDGSALDLTVATMLPPVSPAFNGIGILPDYESSLSAAQESAYYDLTLAEDSQIQRAIEVAQALIKVNAAEKAKIAAASGSSASVSEQVNVVSSESTETTSSASSSSAS